MEQKSFTCTGEAVIREYTILIERVAGTGEGVDIRSRYTDVAATAVQVRTQTVVGVCKHKHAAFCRLVLTGCHFIGRHKHVDTMINLLTIDSKRLWNSATLYVEVKLYDVID